MAHIRLIEEFPEVQWPAIVALAASIDAFNADSSREQLLARRRILTCLASVDGALAGYKIGYEERPGYFESWIGGVVPNCRRQGIAAQLMAAQHTWCREQGFRFISTVTLGDNRAMLIANLHAGFEVCGTFHDRRKLLKVILQKHLA